MSRCSLPITNPKQATPFATCSTSYARSSLPIKTSPFLRNHRPLPCRLHPGFSFPPPKPSTSRTRTSAFAFETNYILKNGIMDYYELLGVDDDATEQEIKSAYRALAKVCHPDISGEEEGHNMCILLNEAYETLMDADQRRQYNAALDEALDDEDDGYTGEPLSKWCANTKFGKNTNADETRAVFVDEITCIGCKQCVWCAPATFRIEEEFGRSRVFGQWLDKEDDLQAAINACPVSCIHWVEKEDLALLEYVTSYKLKRVNVGIMMAGQGGATDDVWDVAARYLKEREEKKKARERAAKYSKQQEAMRAAAAAGLAQQQSGWFKDVADKLGMSDAASKMWAAMESNVSGTESEDEYSVYKKLGKRRRSRVMDPAQYGSRGSGGGKIPLERSLVPVGVGGRKRWERD